MCRIYHFYFGVPSTTRCAEENENPVVKECTTLFRTCATYICSMTKRQAVRYG